MQHGARVRIESYDSRDGAGLTRSFHHRAHDQLMPKMQPVKHAQGQDRRALDIRVVGSVK
jgi:hypothetical protein